MKQRAIPPIDGTGASPVNLVRTCGGKLPVFGIQRNVIDPEVRCMLSCTNLASQRSARGGSSFWVLPVLALLTVTLFVASAAAQMATGNIVGYVKDSSGAAIP